MIRQRLTGLAATLGIARPPRRAAAGCCSRSASGPCPPSPRWADLVDLLLRRDDGSLALVVIKAIGWVTWALLAGMILLEVVAGLRGVRPPTYAASPCPKPPPGTSSPPQQPCSWRCPPARFPRTPTPPPPPRSSPPSPSRNRTPRGRSRQPAEAAPPTRPHTVKRGESLWSIAEKQLGDGRRYTEIAALNTRLLDGKGDGFLKPGWTLNLPLDEDTVAASATASATSYTVRKGDTLSEIALDHYGDARAYPRIVEASRHLTQPDGRHLTNPDVIDVGWTLTLPQPSTNAATPQTEGVPEQSTPSTDATRRTGRATPRDRTAGSPGRGPCSGDPSHGAARRQRRRPLR